MWSVRTLLAVATTLAPLVSVSATPEGVPEQACVSMCPRGPVHQDASPQSAPMPYNVSVTAVSGVVHVTISQTPGGPSFMGFMVQARAADSNTPLGTFTPVDDQVKTIACINQGDTASHINGTPKSMVSLTWTSPFEYSGDIFIFVTVVEIPTTFWVHQEVGTFTFT